MSVSIESTKEIPAAEMPIVLAALILLKIGIAKAEINKTKMMTSG